MGRTLKGSELIEETSKPVKTVNCTRLTEFHLNSLFALPSRKYMRAELHVSKVYRDESGEFGYIFGNGNYMIMRLYARDGTFSFAVERKLLNPQSERVCRSPTVKRDWPENFNCQAQISDYPFLEKVKIVPDASRELKTKYESWQGVEASWQGIFVRSILRIFRSPLYFRVVSIVLQRTTEHC